MVYAPVRNRFFAVAISFKAVILDGMPRQVDDGRIDLWFRSFWLRRRGCIMLSFAASTTETGALYYGLYPRGSIVSGINAQGLKAFLFILLSFMYFSIRLKYSFAGAPLNNANMRSSSVILETNSS